jgi:hypothetical protein
MWKRFQNKRVALNIVCFLLGFLFCVFVPNDYRLFLPFFVFALFPLSLPAIITAIWFMVKVPPWQSRQKDFMVLLGVLAGCIFLIITHARDWEYVMRSWTHS